jgi:RNA polymerase sigma-70 factor (ECF subfamily)
MVVETQSLRGAGPGTDPSGKDGARERARQQFLDLLMPLYPSALAYAQSMSGSLMDGEDLLSDAILKAFAKFHTLRDTTRFKAWFFSILLNRFRNHYRRSLLRPLTLVAEPSRSMCFWEATARVSGDPAELGYQLTLVKEMLGRLAPAEREAVVLLGPAGFSVDEVAAIQRCSRRAVIQRAYRARLKLGRMLPDEMKHLAGLAAEVNAHERV